MKTTLREIGRKLLRNERGTTLVEELVTIAIIGSGIVILVTMITTGALGVMQINDIVRADNLAKSQIELIKDAPYQASYPTVSSLPGYSVDVEIENLEVGLQKITVTVSSGANQITQLVGYKVDR